MNMQAKSRLVLSITLIIGVSLGILIDRTVIHQSFESRIERFRGPGGFSQIIERIIEPDSKQMEQIKIILEKHAKKMNDYRNKSRAEMKVLMDSLRIELEPVLTREQKEKLKESMDRMERRPFDSRGRRQGRRFDKENGPPPPEFERDSPFLP